MKKQIIALLLMLSILLSVAPITGLAASEEAIQAANALYGLGLFQGTGTNADGTPNFDLDRTPTRHEAVTMLVRLLGKDAEAKAGTWETPFTDVDDWAKPYVGYAYANGLTTGTSETTFGGANTIDAPQYLTFVLRALGYESGVDFQWDDPWTLAKECGLTSTYRFDSGHNIVTSTDTDPFTRGDIAELSDQALFLYPKGKDERLQASIVEISEAKLQGVWRQAWRQAETEYVFSGNNYTYSCYSADGSMYHYEAGTFQIEAEALKLSYVETHYEEKLGLTIESKERTQSIFRLSETSMETSYTLHYFPAYEKVTTPTVTEKVLEKIDEVKSNITHAEIQTIWQELYDITDRDPKAMTAFLEVGNYALQGDVMAISSTSKAQRYYDMANAKYRSGVLPELKASKLSVQKIRNILKKYSETKSMLPVLDELEQLYDSVLAYDTYEEKLLEVFRSYTTGMEPLIGELINMVKSLEN